MGGSYGMQLTQTENITNTIKTYSTKTFFIEETTFCGVFFWPSDFLSKLDIRTLKANVAEKMPKQQKIAPRKALYGNSPNTMQFPTTARKTKTVKSKKISISLSFSLDFCAQVFKITFNKPKSHNNFIFLPLQCELHQDPRSLPHGPALQKWSRAIYHHIYIYIHPPQ